MPRFRNIDFNCDRNFVDQLQTEIDRAAQSIGLVMAGGYPGGYVHRDEATQVPEVPRNHDRYCEGSTPLVWVHRNNLASCDQCSCEFNGDSHAIHEFDTVFCSTNCRDQFMVDRGAVTVETSHGRDWQYIPGTNTPGQIAPYNTLWFPGHHAPVSQEHPARIGFEVEKEDMSFHESCCDTDILSDALDHDWIAVSDGSLDEETGFELVSPGYNLTDPEGEYGAAAMERTLRSWSALDAETSNRCGGHITVSVDGLSGPQLAERLKPFYAVMYALYPTRLLGQYAQPCRGSRSVELCDHGKFRAVNVLSDRVEFRLFSAVETGEQLIRRVDLIRAAVLCIMGNQSPLMVAEANEELESAIGNPESALMVAVESLAGCDDYGNVCEPTPDSIERTTKRNRRIRCFSKWFASGAISDCIRRYVPC